MSQLPADDPIPGDAHSCDAVEQVIVPSAKDLGGFSVRRALPSAGRKMIGPSSSSTSSARPSSCSGRAWTSGRIPISDCRR